MECRGEAEGPAGGHRGMGNIIVKSHIEDGEEGKKGERREREREREREIWREVRGIEDECCSSSLETLSRVWFSNTKS
jgi:hypothetical protein